MKIEYSAKTDVGKLRKENQDSFGISKAKNFYFVCDGMGGGAAGDFASRTAVEVILQSMVTLKKSALATLAGSVMAAVPEEFQYPAASIRLANRALWNFSSRYAKLSGMGTTIVAALYDERKAMLHIYHVGDSRLYRMRSGNFELLTRDHSKVNELLEQGKMREEEVKTAEIQSMITRALGTGARVKVDYRTEFVLPGDHFVLCSDGLNTELDDEEIKKIVAAGLDNSEEITGKLIAAANNAGGRDNTTVITMIAVNDDSEPMPYIKKPVSVNTLPEETAEETNLEDRVLKEILTAAGIKVPKNALEKGILSNPLYLGILITALIVGAGILLTRVNKRPPPDTELMDLAGKITGLRVDIRTPSEEQMSEYNNCEDTVQRLQMIQDWNSDRGQHTLPLRNVEIILTREGKEQFRGLTGGSPLEVRVDRGIYQMHFSYANYRILTEKMESKDILTVSVEPSEALRPVVIILVPENKGGNSSDG
ncbi:MAG: PP2C family protein-serine/threonine phosphatase [Endomicrobiales bacterium]